MKRPTYSETWGDIPADWDLVRIAHVVRIPNGLVDPTDDQYAALTLIAPNHIESHTGRLTARESAEEQGAASGKYLVQQGDLVYSKIRPELNKVTVAPEVCLCSADMYPIRPNRNVLNSRYLLYVMQSRPFWMRTVDESMRVAMPKVNRQSLGGIRVPVPPIPLQRAIASFLDRETVRIDTLIEKKRRLLDLLEEKRTALITRAVTRGLDPEVPMKDSGVEWIGEIPEHWEVARLGRLISRIDQGWSPVADDRTVEQGEVGVLKLSAIKRGRFFASEHKRLTSTERLSQRLLLREGDLLVTRSNTPELVGDACIVADNIYALIPSDLVYRLQPKQDLLTEEFLLNWFLSAPHRAQLKVDARGSSKSMVKISQGHILNWVLPRPPREEQAWIVRRLHAEVSKIRAVSDRIIAAIDLLTEYRTALISSAVTGKIDVTEPTLAPA